MSGYQQTRGTSLTVRILAGAVLLGAAVAVMSSVPQMRRYLRIKRM